MNDEFSSSRRIGEGRGLFPAVRLDLRSVAERENNYPPPPYPNGNEENKVFASLTSFLPSREEKKNDFLIR
jgi:hypothetical protein